MITDTIAQKLTDAIAAKLHELWREGFEAANGQGAVRMKDDGQGGECNINAPFDTLPAKWKAENLAAAASAVRAADKSIGDLGDLYGWNPPADRLREMVADQIHEDWMERNGSWAPADQMLPYQELSEKEKDKDRVIADLAISYVRGEYMRQSEMRRIESEERLFEERVARFASFAVREDAARAASTGTHTAHYVAYVRGPGRKTRRQRGN